LRKVGPSAARQVGAQEIVPKQRPRRLRGQGRGQGYGRKGTGGSFRSKAIRTCRDRSRRPDSASRTSTGPGFCKFARRADAQAIFCRRRHQPRRPPLAKIRPGRPAPAIGPGTGGSVTVTVVTKSVDIGTPRREILSVVVIVNWPKSASLSPVPSGTMKLMLARHRAPFARIGPPQLPESTETGSIQMSLGSPAILFEGAVAKLFIVMLAPDTFVIA
jgi:hypothetical protein